MFSFFEKLYRIESYLFIYFKYLFIYLFILFVSVYKEICETFLCVYTVSTYGKDILNSQQTKKITKPAYFKIRMYKSLSFATYIAHHLLCDCHGFP